MDGIYMKLTFFNLLSFIVFAYKNVGNEGVSPRFSPIQAVPLSQKAVGLCLLVNVKYYHSFYINGIRGQCPLAKSICLLFISISVIQSWKNFAQRRLFLVTFLLTNLFIESNWHIYIKYKPSNKVMAKKQRKFKVKHNWLGTMPHEA